MAYDVLFNCMNRENAPKRKSRMEGIMLCEYIDKQALMKKFADVVGTSNNSDFQNPPTWNDAVEITENFPTTDVRPVVRGFNKNKDYPSLFECSVCGWCCDDTTRGDSSVWNFCPNCGADMM